MNRIDFDAINHRLDPARMVPQWLPDGRRQGNEWVARNPTRSDRRCSKESWKSLHRYRA